MSVSVAQAGNVSVLLTPAEQKLLVTNPDSSWQEKNPQSQQELLNPSLCHKPNTLWSPLWIQFHLLPKKSTFHTITKVTFNLTTTLGTNTPYSIKHKQFSLSVQGQTPGSLYIGKQLLIEALSTGWLSIYNNLRIA